MKFILTIVQLTSVAPSLLHLVDFLPQGFQRILMVTGLLPDNSVENGNNTLVVTYLNSGGKIGDKIMAVCCELLTALHTPVI
jgi:hypothetical protein